ncbi:hypothetical protein SAMN04488515_0036 [Cognatiyoonia koreensis]|uniref:VPLPA-CTERM protein sorting domain-containing protein n=1 Tax=Cognatiyoonia koreensis TaxID=364200 RepID=A0A1I0MJD1_9RHOB|nr:VPLPA-CTERM sorting domain-containing protein [Cognatiyoonia koreensis]SEV88108.1 hypothetical protein SAMN04488515_0036 [Cognatiyoonia koreensis]
MNFFGKTAIALAITTLAAPASAATITIDFEGTTGFYGPNDPSINYGTGGSRGTGISGLIFDRPIQVGTGPFFGAPGPAQSGNIARQANPPFGAAPSVTNERGSTFGGSFDGFTVSSLSLVVGDSGGDLDIFELLGFDVDGNEITTSGVLRSNSELTIAIAGTGIASFLLNIDDDNSLLSGGSSTFDNIVFETEVSTVPLPASLPLVGFALASLGLVGRLRKKR